MSKRVFANNNDMSYNNYYSKIKFKRIRKIHNYLNYNNIKPPINAIDGSTSVYINKYTSTDSNCVECINSTDLCDEQNCNNAKMLYPHGICVKTYYNNCNKTIIKPNLNTLTYNLDNYYNLDNINTTVITSLNNNLIIPINI